MGKFQAFQDLLPEMGEQKASVSQKSYDSIFYYWRLQGKFAFDPETESIIWRSRGRRKSGSKGRRYTVHIPGELRVNDINGTGKEYQGVYSFIADNDDEAIRKANMLFPKNYERFVQQREVGTR